MRLVATANADAMNATAFAGGKMWSMGSQKESWPALSVADWAATRDTLQLWTQIVGKVRIVSTPLSNHWWNVPLYVSSRGLTTSLIPRDGRGSRSTSTSWQIASTSRSLTGARLA